MGGAFEVRDGEGHDQFSFMIVLNSVENAAKVSHQPGDWTPDPTGLCYLVNAEDRLQTMPTS